MAPKKSGVVNLNLKPKMLAKRPASALTKQALDDAADANPEKFAHMSLDEKIAYYREHDDATCFNPDDFHKLSGRYTSARKKNTEAENQWSTVSQLGFRQGMQAKKRGIILAWLQDPDFGEAFYCLNG